MQTAAVRVLLLNQVFHPDPQATSQYLSRLAEEFVKQGHDVTVVTGSRNYDDPSQRFASRETWQGVEIIRVWQSGLGHGATWKRAVDFATFLLSSALRGLFLRRPDVVVALTSPPLVSVLGGVLAGIWRARFVYWVMDMNPDEVVAVGWLKPDSLPTRWLESASRWSLEQAHKIIVPDVYMRNRILGKGIADEKVEVIPLWMQREVTFDAAGRERFRKLHLLADKYVVMYAGNHTACHPLDTLIDAARLLQDEPRIRFCFVGGGMEWRRLRDRTREEGFGNVSFLGYQPLAELPALLSAADRQVVVMGDPLVGIVHPCKVYNFLAAQRPYIYVGPDRSHVTDLIRDAGLEEVTASFRHGEASELAEELRRGVLTVRAKAWPDNERMKEWSEVVVLKKLISTVTSFEPANNSQQG